MQSETLLKIRDVAARLNCSEAFVYALVSRGRLKHFRLGKGSGGIRVSEAHLREFLEETERGTDRPERPVPAPLPVRLKHLTLD